MITACGKSSAFRKTIGSIAVALCGLAGFAAAAPLQAQEVQAKETTLRFGHLWPEAAGMHQEVFQVWADTIERDSGGQLKVEMHPAQALAKAPDQYAALTQGVMDVTATVLGYSAGRFPLAQMVEAPGMSRTGVGGSCVLQALYNEGVLDEEFRDSRPLFLFTHGPGLVHTGSTAVTRPEEFAGLRLRRPTNLIGEILQSFGAIPVAMPAPRTREAMEAGEIDGAVFPWEGALSFRLNELTQYHTDFGALYTIAFIVTMNRDSYVRLPAELREIVNRNSGMKWAQLAGRVFDAADEKGRAEAESLGHAIYEVEGGVNNPIWSPTLNQATRKYISDLEGRGIPARMVYHRAQTLARKCRSGVS